MRTKRILMVSMPSLHFFRWANQLQNEGFEVYWFDITDGGQFVGKIDWIQQITDWKLRFDFPGRSYIKKNFKNLYQSLSYFNERNVNSVFESKIKEIQPDIVHSFALYVSCTPIFKVMCKYPSIKWVYSSWGSDLFYFQNESSYLKDIKAVLPRVDYLFTDCKRDYGIAKTYGFEGQFLGVFPGGGGFDFSLMNLFKKPFLERNIILIKGFQGRSGRAIEVLKAIEGLKARLNPYKILVFGATNEVFVHFEGSVLKEWGNVEVIGRVKHEAVMELMGKAILYIGNSNSDGMPNTLLEAICMDVVPVQSNPGGATEEIIRSGINGFLINDSEDIEGIQNLINQVVTNLRDSYDAIVTYNKKLQSVLEHEYVKHEVVKKYKSILEKI